MEVIENIEELAPQVLFNFKNSGNNITTVGSGSGSPNLFGGNNLSHSHPGIPNSQRKKSGSIEYLSSSPNLFANDNENNNNNSTSRKNSTSSYIYPTLSSSPIIVETKGLSSSLLKNSNNNINNNNNKPPSPLFPEVPTSNNNNYKNNNNESIAPIPTLFSFGCSSSIKNNNSSTLIPSSPLSNSSDTLLGSSSDAFGGSSFLSSSPSHSVPSSPPSYSTTNKNNNNGTSANTIKFHNYNFNSNNQPISPSTSYSNLFSTSPNVSSASLQNAFNKSCTISSPNLNNSMNCTPTFTSSAQSQSTSPTPSSPPTPSSGGSAGSGSVQCSLNECLLCLRGQPDVLIKSPTWASIMRVVFFTLHNEMPEKQFFSLKTDVYDFMTSHWDILCLNKKKSDNWHKQIQDMLSHSKNIFESGMDKYKQNGFWRLKQNVDPWILPQKGRKGSSSNCASPALGLTSPMSPSSSMSSNSNFVPSLGSPLMLSSPNKLYSRIFADEISISGSNGMGGRKRSLSAIDPHTSSSALSLSSPSILPSSPCLEIQMDLEIRKKRNSNSEYYSGNNGNNSNNNHTGPSGRSNSLSLQSSPLSKSTASALSSKLLSNRHQLFTSQNSNFSNNNNDEELYIDDNDN